MGLTMRKAVYAVVALAVGFAAHCAASSEVGARNAVRAPSEWIKIPLAFAVSFAVYVGLWYGLKAMQQIPSGNRPLVWTAIVGWTAACLLAAFVVSVFHALYLAKGPQRLFTPADWILTRSFIAGLFLAFVPATAIIRSVNGRSQIVGRH